MIEIKWDHAKHSEGQSSKGRGKKEKATKEQMQSK
jgi:hypothetical protein